MPGRFSYVLISRGSRFAVRLLVVTACIPIGRTASGHADATPVIRGAPVPGAPAGVAAFVDVNVVPMDTERVLANQTVLVEAGKITALGPASQVQVPAGAAQVDGRGKYLMPGLADMHTHLGYPVTDWDSHLNITQQTPPDSMAERRLFYWLATGVTTVRNMDYSPQMEHNVGGNHYKLDTRDLLRFRAQAAAGKLWSPRIYTSGPWGPRQYLESYKGAPPPSLDSIAGYVAAYKAAGYDHLKIHDEPLELIDSVLVAARRIGLPVVGHNKLPHDRNLPSAQALAGYRSFEHFIGYYFSMGKYRARDTSALVMGTLRDTSAATRRAFAEATQRAGVWNCPTLVVGATRPDLVKALQDAGAALLTGTDYPIFITSIGAGERAPIHQELRLLVKHGLTPYQALVAATRSPAAYFGTLDETGTVAVGKRADLVLLTANPLQDIRHTAERAGVMIGGRWLAREMIDRRLAAISAARPNSP